MNTNTNRRRGWKHKLNSDGKPLNVAVQGHQMRLEQARRLILSAMVFPALHDIEHKYPDQPRLDKVWAAVREAEQHLEKDEESTTSERKRK